MFTLILLHCLLGECQQQVIGADLTHDECSSLVYNMNKVLDVNEYSTGKLMYKCEEVLVGLPAVDWWTNADTTHRIL